MQARAQPAAHAAAEPIAFAYLPAASFHGAEVTGSLRNLADRFTPRGVA